MRVPNDFLKTVGFVSRDEESLIYKGTAFIVKVPIDEEFGLLHLVTAKHVAKSLQDGEAVLAFNGKDGAPLWMKNTTEVQWYFHPDPSVDVAILPMATTRTAEYDYEAIPISRFLAVQNEQIISIGIGDETITIGLFAPFVGADKLTPIVRTGTVAMMPDGRLPHPVFGSIFAYLVESRSTGGLSGSPVFVRNTVNLPVMSLDGSSTRASALGEFYFLGLVHGHWSMSIDKGDAKGQDTNMGICLVVPSLHILEALNAEPLASQRQRWLDENSSTISPSQDCSTRV